MDVADGVWLQLSILARRLDVATEKSSYLELDLDNNRQIPMDITVMT